MKKVIAEKVTTTFCNDADKSKVYVTILDGRQALLVTYDVFREEYTSVTLSVHCLRKVLTDSGEDCVGLTTLLHDYIATGYNVYECDSLVEALMYITDNI